MQVCLATERRFNSIGKDGILKRGKKGENVFAHIPVAEGASGNSCVFSISYLY